MRATVSGGGGDFKLPEEGLTVGRCVRVIDLGTQERVWSGKTSHIRQIFVSFELPDRLVEFDGEEVPSLLSKKYTLSFNEKANLRKDLEQWYGKKFNDADIEASGGFDPSKILDRPAQIMITHSTGNNGKTYANISGLMPLAKNMPIAERHHDLLLLDLDEFDQSVYDSLSENMQEWIAKSPEYQQATMGGSSSEPADDPFDDIPFIDPYKFIRNLV